MVFRRTCAGTGQAASTASFRRDPYLQAYPLTHSLHMGDDAYHLALLMQGGEHVESGVQGFLIQSAEAFVQKDGIHTHVPAGHLCESQGQRQTDDETLPPERLREERTASA